jgi:hypothetical protein
MAIEVQPYHFLTNNRLLFPIVIIPKIFKIKVKSMLLKIKSKSVFLQAKIAPSGHVVICFANGYRNSGLTIVVFYTIAFHATMNSILGGPSASVKTCFYFIFVLDYNPHCLNWISLWNISHYQMRIDFSALLCYSYRLCFVFFLLFDFYGCFVLYFPVLFSFYIKKITVAYSGWLFYNWGFDFDSLLVLKSFVLMLK